MKCVYMRASPAVTLINDIITLISYCVSHWREQEQVVWTDSTQRARPPKYTSQFGMVTLPPLWLADSHLGLTSHNLPYFHQHDTWLYLNDFLTWLQFWSPNHVSVHKNKYFYIKRQHLEQCVMTDVADRTIVLKWRKVVCAVQAIVSWSILFTGINIFIVLLYYQLKTKYLLNVFLISLNDMSKNLKTISHWTLSAAVKL